MSESLKRKKSRSWQWLFDSLNGVKWLDGIFHWQNNCCLPFNAGHVNATFASNWWCRYIQLLRYMFQTNIGDHSQVQPWSSIAILSFLPFFLFFHHFFHPFLSFISSSWFLASVVEHLYGKRRRKAAICDKRENILKRKGEKREQTLLKINIEREKNLE